MPRKISPRLGVAFDPLLYDRCAVRCDRLHIDRRLQAGRHQPTRRHLERPAREKAMDVKHLHLPTARGIHDLPSDAPFWGIPTATIDWCEESRVPRPACALATHEQRRLIPWVDYKITPYIAEFVNTLTNAFFSPSSLPPSADSSSHISRVQCPSRSLASGVSSNSSIIHGLLPPSSDSSSLASDPGCSMPPSSIRYSSTPSAPLSDLGQNTLTF